MNRDEIIRMAQKAGVTIRWHYDETGSTPQELEQFAALVAAHEREACAKVCDELAALDMLSNYYKVAANAIRARGEK
jgi:hypothetical protein